MIKNRQLQLKGHFRSLHVKTPPEKGSANTTTVYVLLSHAMPEREALTRPPYFFRHKKAGTLWTGQSSRYKERVNPLRLCLF